MRSKSTIQWSSFWVDSPVCSMDCFASQGKCGRETVSNYEKPHSRDVPWEEGKKRVMTTRVLWCLRRRPRFSWLRRDYSDNDLRGVFFDRVFCVTRYGRSLDWLRVKSKDRLLFGLEAWVASPACLKSSCCCSGVACCTSAVAFAANSKVWNSLPGLWRGLSTHKLFFRVESE